MSDLCEGVGGRLPRRALSAFLDELAKLAGGREAQEAIQAYLEKYGMRCVGEIDITRPRWSERPATLVPLILDNIRNFTPGEAKRRLEHGRQAARSKEQELLERLRALADGASKAKEAKQMIDRVRTFSGYREYPKYGIVDRYFVYKQALLEEAERLVRADVLRDKEDIFYLTPPGPSKGAPASSETSRRPTSKPATSSSPPTPTPAGHPLFLAIKGLVTEVGGLMTHGRVIAREYGVPAVVAVEHATQLIRDGQRIRVNGTDGYIEILHDPGQPRDGAAPPCAC
ncbi:MAG TPA: PEP-utilizing enzyme [Solirubrobacteraceae bacterium]|nr:PEP-utilizing enzyme [Solirubrobacteraceae bacterium]